MNNSRRTYPPTLPGADVETFKTIGDVEMKMWIFTPDGHSENDTRPAMVFFFGGGFRSGSPGQFAKHCEYLTDRGMVAITADYRVLERHGTRPDASVADAKSAMRHVRANAARLGIDPNRIAASGGSAGGYLAAALATLDGLDDPGDDLSVSANPNALVLFNPGLVSADIPGKIELGEERHKTDELSIAISLGERWGSTPLESVSPYHNVKLGIAPAIIFHGTGDTTIPYQTAAVFWEKMQEESNRCELVGYDGAGHGFFNYGREGNAAFADTVNKMDAFLVSLGYLDGGPTPMHHK
jgi:acetyl esterase/lipase